MNLLVEPEAEAYIKQKTANATIFLKINERLLLGGGCYSGAGN